MNNFLTDINAPNLRSATFASDLGEVFRNIDNNFKKIASAPYLAGQEGRSVEAVDMEIVDADGALTEFGKSMAREIFGSPSIETLSDIDSVAPPVSSGSPSEHSASDYLVMNPTVKVFALYDPDSGEIDDYVCSAEYYLYMDMRVADLGNIPNPSSQVTFVDYTCQMFGEYSDGEWIFSKGVMLPTLYYNSDLEYFCWKINGSETGIRAQGIKGDDGRPPVSAVVRGVGYTGEKNGVRVTTVILDKFCSLRTYEQNGEVMYEGTWSPINLSGLNNGDLVACTFNIIDNDYNVPYPDMLIGNVTITGEGTDQIYTITVPDANRFSSLWRSYLVFYAFRDIDYKSTDPVSTKAVFVPAWTPGVTHAMFQDDSGVQYSETGGEWTSNDTLEQDNLIFKKVSESRLVGEGSIGNANRMTSPDSPADHMSEVKFLGYNMEVEGTSSATVNGVPGVQLGSPVGSVVSWLGTVAIPDGWYETGEISEPGTPVFGLRYVEGEDYDVAVMNGSNPLKKMKFTGITDGGQLGSLDNRFYKIFCTIAGYPIGLPVIIQTTSSTFEDYKLTERFNWNQFDLSEATDGLLFYLTKTV